mmetsp:Transcript_84712/g.213610  ORF Transcript_84712/g.213610 Transcript_84712/m.213610 type:complete len:267 (+) Transcript_84712:36-836(+)
MGDIGGGPIPEVKVELALGHAPAPISVWIVGADSQGCGMQLAKFLLRQERYWAADKYRPVKVTLAGNVHGEDVASLLELDKKYTIANDRLSRGPNLKTEDRPVIGVEARADSDCTVVLERKPLHEGLEVLTHVMHRGEKSAKPMRAKVVRVGEADVQVELLSGSRTSQGEDLACCRKTLPRAWIDEALQGSEPRVGGVRFVVLCDGLSEGMLTTALPQSLESPVIHLAPGAAARGAAGRKILAGAPASVSDWAMKKTVVGGCCVVQ